MSKDTKIELEERGMLGADPGKKHSRRLASGASGDGPIEDMGWQWELTQGRLRMQLERLREALTLEEKCLVMLESRAEYGVAPGEKPLSEGALFKREAMIDKALDRYERQVRETEKRKRECGNEGQDPTWLKERAVMLSILEENPEVLRVFMERMNASDEAR